VNTIDERMCLYCGTRYKPEKDEDIRCIRCNSKDDVLTGVAVFNSFIIEEITIRLCKSCMTELFLK